MTILNVSYDPTRELYQDYNAAFAKYWKAKTGQDVTIKQSHGGSGKQARSVIDGLQADVVTLALAYDIDAISEKAKLLPANWQSRLPNNSTPYTSTIVFLVRKGNPKDIKDWDDLVKPGVAVITPNPKTSGGARWNYLAAWGYAYLKPARMTPRPRISSREALQECAGARFRRARLDHHIRPARHRRRAARLGKRGAAFAEGIRARTSSRSWCPRQSILAEPPVAVVDKVVDKHGTRAVAKAISNISTRRKGRRSRRGISTVRGSSPSPRNTRRRFPKLKLFTLAESFGGWPKTQKIHFADGGVFDQIYQPNQ